MNAFFTPVPLEKAYKLLNHGPTILLSARHQGVDNVMAAAWACALDFSPPKLTVVIDKMTKTRELVEGSGYFVVQVPSAQLAQFTYDVGHQSLRDNANKLADCQVQLFSDSAIDCPLVEGCIAWLACRLIPEPHNQQHYDLFIGEVIHAWADSRVFSKGTWHFESAPAELRSLHYIAGGDFYAIGEKISLNNEGCE